jgi:cytidyltransferase-like protein
MRRVWVNGTFDVMHLGHVKLLEYASSLGIVRVGIDSDSRVKMLKGSDRPFNDQVSRVEFMQSIRYVNDVVLFHTEEDLISSIKEYDPFYIVVGDDYSAKK